MTFTSKIKKINKVMNLIFCVPILFGSVFSSSAFGSEGPDEMRFIQIEAKDKFERTAISNRGVSIEAVRSDSIWGFANSKQIKKVENDGFQILGNFQFDTGRGGHENFFGFPTEDARFHTYDQLLAALKELQLKNSDISTLQSIGKTIEGRDIWALHINTSPDALTSDSSNKPGVIFMGNHHAREHLSLEIPLMLSQYLLGHRRDPHISQMLDARDLWIIPMVNPDGAEYDIATSRYRFWRKNRRNNEDGTFGVDLNRNYGFEWGTGGSDTETSSDVYMGSEPFSEPETQAIRDFVEKHLNAKILLTFHTFSELILYPRGHSYDKIPTPDDQMTFEKMAKTMAQWNHYTPQQASDLYIASGDTTDWAYGKHGIFAFTFELSPSDMMDGGFYPGAKIIDRVFRDNLQPCLYMIDLADNPYRVLDKPSPKAIEKSWLKNYVDPYAPEISFWEPTNRGL
ncbi:MAG: M14 family metallopeptidase [Bdellovibrionia bacterium]